MSNCTEMGAVAASYFRSLRESFSASGQSRTTARYSNRCFAFAALAVLSALPIAANALLLRVLRRQHLRRAFPAFSKHLALLTVAEITFNVGVANYYAWSVTLHLTTRVYLSHWAGLKTFSAAAESVIGCLCCSAESVRNWLLAILTVSRCRILLSALRSSFSPKKLMTMLRLKVVVVVVFLTSLAHSFVAFFGLNTLIACVKRSQNDTTEPAIGHNVMSSGRSFIFFLHMRGLPIFITVVSTGLIFSKIFTPTRSHLKPYTFLKIRSGALMIATTSAAITILEGLGLVFFTMEASLNLSDGSRLLMYTIDKALLLLHSITNIIAFSACNHVIRDEVYFVIERWWYRRC